jgi:glycosyltransferase involved in cell wall biosynthesis
MPAADRHISSVFSRHGPVICIPNGTSVREQVPAPKNDPVLKVVYAGAHGRANDVKTIIEAAREVQRRCAAGTRRVEFHLIGDGEFKASLMTYARSIGTDNVVFHDPVAKKDIGAILSSADCFVASVRKSRLNEFGISPNKLNDYLAAGRPVVLGAQAANNPVSESGAGLTVPPQDPGAMADGILEIMRMPETARWQMGERGRKFVETKRNYDLLCTDLECELMQCLRQNTRGTR